MVEWLCVSFWHLHKKADRIVKGIKMSKFNLLAYILPPEEKVFYSLFEESAQVCHDVATLYKDIVTSALTDD